MTIGRGVRIALSAVIALLCTAAGAAAQTNDEIFPEFQWNFSTPGARANASAMRSGWVSTAQRSCQTRSSSGWTGMKRAGQRAGRWSSA